MTKLYMVTGFLGAGKTTFLKKFVRLFPDKKIALIINEFGASGVDGALLQHLEIAMTEIYNGSIFCACRIEQFERAVCSILENNKPDLIFVEASGLADPTAARSIFSQPIYEDMEYAGAICLVDAARFHKVYQTARVSRMQLAISDLVLINKTDLASREQIENIITIVKAQNPGRSVYETTFGSFDPAWLDSLENTDGTENDGEIHTRDITLRKLTLELSGFDLKNLTSFLKMFAEDTYRVKGFVEIEENKYVVDCVGPLVDVREFTGETVNSGSLTVLYGNGLPAKKSIKEAMSWFPSIEVKVL